MATRVAKSYRLAGHIQPREDIMEWERFWVVAFSGEGGYTYRTVAAAVYGLQPHEVTVQEESRVGRIARGESCGCMHYRRGETPAARRHMADITRRMKQQASCIQAPNIRALHFGEAE